MKKNYKNKKLSSQNTKGRYTFPKHGKVIEANDLGEAQEKLAKELKQDE